MDLPNNQENLMSSNVKAIPDGYTSVTPYLIVGDAAKAIEFYKKAFGAKELLRMDSPGGKVGHAELMIGDSKIMLADVCQEKGAKCPKEFGGSPISIHLYVNDVDQTVKHAVAAGGTLTRPVENMFYGDRNGMIQDPFGHLWCVSTHVEEVS